jgi:hypothetical protein
MKAQRSSKKQLQHETIWRIRFESQLKTSRSERDPAMLRSILALSAIALTAAPAAASSYSAAPSVPAGGRFVTRDIVWNCGPAACQGATDESRPLVLCQSLAKRVGRIDSFLADGRALAADDLTRCNAVAKAPATQALAAQ